MSSFGSLPHTCNPALVLRSCFGKQVTFLCPRPSPFLACRFHPPPFSHASLYSHDRFLFVPSSWHMDLFLPASLKKTKTLLTLATTLLHSFPIQAPSSLPCPSFCSVQQVFILQKQISGFHGVYLLVKRTVINRWVSKHLQLMCNKNRVTESDWGGGRASRE